MKRIFNYLLAITLSAPVFVAQAEIPTNTQSQDVSIEHYKYFGDLPKAKLIRVINPYGGITSRSNSYDSVELSGVIQKIGPHGAEHKIDIYDKGGVTEVIVSYPNGNKDEQGKLRGRFDLGVWVPGYINVELVTDFGDIKVKSSASNIVATSTSGNIKIATSGTASAFSDSGEVKINLTQKSPKLPARLFKRHAAELDSQQKTTTTKGSGTGAATSAARPGQATP